MAFYNASNMEEIIERSVKIADRPSKSHDDFSADTANVCVSLKPLIDVLTDEKGFTPEQTADLREVSKRNKTRTKL